VRAVERAGVLIDDEVRRLRRQPYRQRRLVGTETLPVFQHGAKAIAACMAKVEIVEIEGVGHGAPFQETDDLCNEIVRGPKTPP
jgi:hypothetical protein